MYESCRRMGHAWDELPGPPQGMDVLGRDVWLRCTRCTMLRAFDIAPNGQAMWPRYFPPEGYAWKGTRGEAPSKADYRISWLQDIRNRQRGKRGT
jgi:hypothetical protein